MLIRNGDLGALDADFFIFGAVGTLHAQAHSLTFRAADEVHHLVDGHVENIRPFTAALSVHSYDVVAQFKAAFFLGRATFDESCYFG